MNQYFKNIWFFTLGISLGILAERGRDDMLSIFCTCILSLEFSVNLVRGLDSWYDSTFKKQD
jgi:hypothetical protein